MKGYKQLLKLSLTLQTVFSVGTSVSAWGNS